VRWLEVVNCKETILFENSALTCVHRAKYPLAIVDHLLDTLGDDLAVGYDIGCTFESTLKGSKMVGAKAERQKLSSPLNAFHGWAHNRLCQLLNHPLFRQGLGLEDLEVLERIFSASNSVARCVRFASRFTWKQFLDLHFQQWDEDKYAELSMSPSLCENWNLIFIGNFLLDNYRQALRIIATHTPEVEALKDRLKISNEGIEGWRAEEIKFLQELKEEPESRELEVSYVQALLDKQEAE
jgi:hypothetical protein